MFIEELYKFLIYMENIPLYRISNTLGYCFTHGLSSCVLSIKNRNFDELRILFQNDKLTIYLAKYDRTDSNLKVSILLNLDKNDVLEYDNHLSFILSHGRLSPDVDETVLENLTSINKKLEKVPTII